MSDNIFTKIFKKKDEKKFVFDESYFNVSILGGKLHTECIKVEATIVQNGEKLDTLCTWFLVTNRDIIKLELQGN